MRSPGRKIVASIIGTFLLATAAAPSGAQIMPVGSEFQVNTYTTEDQDWPAVAMAADGQFVVVWHDGAPQRDGDNLGISARRYSSSGTPIGSEFLVNSFTLGEQFDPAVAMSPNGAFIVAWGAFPYGDGDSDGTRAQLFTSSGAKNGSEFLVNTFTIRAQEIPDVVMDQAANFVITWNSQTQDGDNYGIFARRYSSNGSPIGAEFMVNTFTIAIQSYPAIGIDSAANFVVVWRSNDQDGDGFGVFGQRFASTGGPLGSEFQVNTSTVGSQSFSDVQKEADGDFVVVWGGLGGVFAQRFGSGGGRLGTEFQVSSDGDSGSRPRLAFDPNGFLVVWISNDDQILGRRFDSLGTAIGTDFQVNTYTDSFHGRPAVASDNTFRFVVGWRSSEQDGYQDGIFAQLLQGPTATATVTPTSTPSATPTSTPSSTPTSTSTTTPTSTPTSTPTTTPTSTPTPTSTSTPTATATPTPTNTPLPIGATCDDDARCVSAQCTDGVCCETACGGALEQCNLPGREGLCTSIVAPAPAVSGNGLAIAVCLVTLIGLWSLRRLRAS